MLEPTPDRSARAAGEKRPVRRAAWPATLLTCLLLVAPAAPAAALGEDGPFVLPLETSTLSLAPGAVTSIPLLSLIEDEEQEDIDPSTAQLRIPDGFPPADSDLMDLSEDARSLTVTGEGTWSLTATDLVFTPQPGIEGPRLPVSLTIDSIHGTRSTPRTFDTQLLELTDSEARGSAGDDIRIQLQEPIPDGGSVRLQLDGLPAGSTLMADGSRVTIPEQGLWQLSADSQVLTHSPSGNQLGRQPDPVRYLVVDEEGAPVRAGRVAVTVPVISDLYHSAPFGEDIVFSVGEGQQFVDPSTLELEPIPGDLGDVSDGTEVTVQGQGRWTLDRETATVRFSPESADVHQAAPIRIRGGDGEGHEAAPALLSTAYPLLADRAVAAPPGTDAVFDLNVGIRDVRPDSLRFDPEQDTADAVVSSDGLSLRVPNEGTWRIDAEARTVTMVPDSEFSGAVTPARLIAEGVYAQNPVSAVFDATFSPVIATLRDDEERTAPGTPLTVDVLGNDTAGSGSQPLDPTTVEIRSMSATNLSQVVDGRGRRLVMPGEGVYTVAQNGSITFVPDPEFVGRTTPVDYIVRDSAGISVTATLLIDVDPAITGTSGPRTEASGINSLLVGLMPTSPATSIVFGTVVMLLLFAGTISLWIGSRMELDRRNWED